MSRHVVVVGGGIAGLTAAHRLTHATPAVTVTLIEAADHLGGKLRTTPFAGRLVDEGADAFLLRVPWAADLCARLGLTGELVNPAVRNAFVWSRGALRSLPPQLMGVPTDMEALVRSGLISPEGLARVADDLTLPRTPLRGDEAIGPALERRLGREVVDRMIDPLIGGINAGDVDQLSLAAVVPQLDAALRDPDHPSLIEACRAQQRSAAADPSAPIFASPAGGMGRLVSALAADLGPATVRLGRRVEAVEPAGADGVHHIVLDDGTTLDADAVVVALPAPAAARALSALAPAAAETMAGLTTTSMAFVTLSLGVEDVPGPLDGSGFLVPRAEGTAVTACSWSSSKWAHLGPEAGDGTLVMRASVGRHGDQAALDLDDADLVARVVDDLGLTMGLSGAPAEARVSRWPDSFPQYAPGHLDRIAAAEASLPPTVALAGAALRGVGVPRCIQTANAAADRILATLA